MGANGRRTIDFCETTKHTPIVVTQKSHRPAPSAKNEQDEYATFANALKKVLSVTHSEIKTKLEKRKRTRKPSASRASIARD